MRATTRSQPECPSDARQSDTNANCAHSIMPLLVVLDSEPTSGNLKAALVSPEIPEIEVAGFTDTDSAVECTLRNKHRVFAFIQDSNRPAGTIIPQWKSLTKARTLQLGRQAVSGDFYTFVIDAFAPTAAFIWTPGTLLKDEQLLLHAWREADSRIACYEKPVSPPDLLQTIKHQLDRWTALFKAEPSALAAETRAVEPLGDELSLMCAGNADYLDRLSPRQFEELVASLFRNHGFDVELTAKTKDGGYDIVAISSANLRGETTLIEVKHFAPHRPVGVGVVRALYGVKHFRSARKVILATSSYVSPDAKREFTRVIPWELELLERNQIVNWCEKYAKGILAQQVKTSSFLEDLTTANSLGERSE